VDGGGVAGWGGGGLGGVVGGGDGVGGGWFGCIVRASYLCFRIGMLEGWVLVGMGLG